MRKLKSHLLLGLVVFLANVISGCSTGTAITVQPSPTTSLLPTRTATASSLPSATATLTLTATPIPTLTPLPTLSPAEAQALVLDLLETNRDCRLPCWWGIVPGKTSWQEARHYLEPLSSKISEIGKPEDVLAEVFIFSIPQEISAAYMAMRFDVKHQTILYIIAYGFEGLPVYRLASFLGAYGPPGEIWISTYRSYPGVIPFVLVLYYPDQGIIASYSAKGVLKDNYIYGCLTDSASFRLWTPEMPITFAEAAKLFYWDIDGAPYQPLEAVTKMDVEAFYSTFNGVETTPCIRTPAELWPGH